MSDWDPDLYNRFRRYRAEPVELILSRLVLAGEDQIVDLGCGTGENTIELARRSSDAEVVGIDLSPAMIDGAQKNRAALPPAIQNRLSFKVGNIAEFNSARGCSLIFSNAALQWIPNHREVLERWRCALAPGGRMVIQMPANDRETAKVELSKLAREDRWRIMLDGVDASFREVPPPEKYAEILRELGFVEIDCFYHVFHHPMGSPAEVVEWYRATGLRPFIEALPQERRATFLDEYRSRLERAYETTGAVTFDFRRLFIWARRPGD
jgi:trans-aconitate 2-methyltransferase